MVAFGAKVRAALTLLVLVPFWTSLMVRTFAWVILLQDNGPVHSVLKPIGLGDVHLIRTNLGVVIGMSQILLPFMVLPLYAVLAGIDRRLVLASASLGARPLTSFARIWVPLSLPGVGAGCLMVFISSLGFYVTPAFWVPGQRTDQPADLCPGQQPPTVGARRGDGRRPAAS